MAEIASFLKKRAAEGLTRELRPIRARRGGAITVGEREYLDFSSNDYLGLASHPALIEAAKEALDAFGAGSSASRLLSGDLEIHHRLEDETARFKQKESALVFGTGYQANVGIISALCSRGDVIFSDRMNHASIVDGMLLSGARFFRFDHNDTARLGSLLKKERGRYKNALIITETIFSMDGDRPPLRQLVELKERYDCRLMTDEAHATGIYGRDGAGVVEEEALADRVDLIMGTFSKALGSFGAYIASSRQTIDYLINASRGFIYSTALPPSVAAADLAAIGVVRCEPGRRRELLRRAAYFRDALKKKGFAVKGESQIVPVIIGDNREAVRFARALQENGYWVLPIRPPTVPDKGSRLRFSITVHHTEEILRRLIDAISNIKV